MTGLTMNCEDYTTWRRLQMHIEALRDSEESRRFLLSCVTASLALNFGLSVIVVLLVLRLRGAI